KPGGALSFFGVTANELHNRHIPLSLLWGQCANDLYEQLLAAQTPDACFQILEETLLARLYRAKHRHQAVAYALTAFGQLAPQMQVTDVVDSIGLSATRFIQVFREDTGFTPKRYMRLLRFQQALQHLAHQTALDYVDIALLCGYYDQAHFINEFRYFSGITPSQYMPQSKDHLLNIPV
ncbi:MAG: helix-turn-helix domain-containing protein, partial [Aggregatilineales bacterium]